MHSYNVVVVDDDIDMLESIQYGLKDDFRVIPFSTPVDAVSFLSRHPVDAVLLDYHMPGTNSFDLYKELRNNKFERPILFLTGEGCPEVKINSLEIGVDDFLQKPISMEELGAYLRNRIRRFSRTQPDVLNVENLQINIADPMIKVEGKEVILTRKEFQILSILCQRINEVVKKTDLVKELWPDVKVQDNNLDTHMSNLRKKISSFTGRIITLKGFGYSLRNH